MRPRFSVAGGKSDSFDSFVLAALARTDSHRFRVLVPDSDRTKALRAMTRARDGLVRSGLPVVNRPPCMAHGGWLSSFASELASAPPMER